MSCSEFAAGVHHSRFVQSWGNGSRSCISSTWQWRNSQFFSRIFPSRPLSQPFTSPCCLTESAALAGIPVVKGGCYQTHRIGAAIYGVPWIPSTKTPFMLAYIPAPAGSVMGMEHSAIRKMTSRKNLWIPPFSSTWWGSSKRWTTSS